MSCLVRDLSSLRVDQSARCPVRQSSSPRVGNLRVGLSAELSSYDADNVSRRLTCWFAYLNTQLKHLGLSVGDRQLSKCSVCMCVRNKR